MRFRILGQMLTGLAVALGATGASATPSHAQSNQFYCGTSKGVPATIVRTPRGNLPVIRWSSDHFSGSGWTPQQRCDEVSQRFQEFLNNGMLKYITTGKMNNQLVVCVASRKGGDCTGLLFTLKPGSNPSSTLARLLNYQALVAGGAINESGERLYIDMDEYLNGAPIEAEDAPSAAPTLTPNTSESSDTPWLAQ